MNREEDDARAEAEACEREQHEAPELGYLPADATTYFEAADLASEEPTE